MHRHLILLCLAGLVLAVPASGTVILSHPTETTIDGTYSDFGDNWKADNFALTQRTTLETISWAGYYGGPQTISSPVAFNIRFYNDDGGVPGVPSDPFIQEYNVVVDAVPTGDIMAAPFGDSPMYSYMFTLPSITLDPGGYWVGIGEADVRTPKLNDSQWLWARSTTSEGHAYGTPWQFLGGRDLALTLTGTPMAPVPEPLTIMLLGFGLAGLGVARRMRKSD